MELSINNRMHICDYRDKQKEQKQAQSFTGLSSALVGGLRFLDNSPALGAVAVDIGSMVIPRTAVDMKDRGFNAGVETGVREVASSANHGIVGLVGAAAAIALSGKFNKDFGVKADKIFINSDAIDVLGTIRKASSSKVDFYKNVLERSEGLDGSFWKKFALKEGETVSNFGYKGEKTLSEVIAETLATITEDTDKKTKESILKKAADIFISNTGGVKQRIQVDNLFKDIVSDPKKDKLVVENTVGVLLDNMVSLGNAFEKQLPKNADVVANAVERQVKDNLPEFMKRLRTLKGKTAVLGLTISSIIGMSVQPINRYLTKKRTGQDGFVGVKGQKADNSPKFRTQKTVAAIAAGAASILSIGNPKSIPGKLQFSSMVPNMDQFKFLYGMTIMSRLLSARGGDELREGLIKDSLGFLTWLIFGGMVSKTAARVIGGKHLINYAPKDTAEKGIKHTFKWLVKAATKSYDEVLLADSNVKNLLKSGENLKFSTMLKSASKAGKKNVAILAASQIIGYLFSGFVLGMGIAKLNIAITNKVNKKREEKAGNTSSVNQTQSNPLYFAQANNNSKAGVFAGIFKKV